MTALCPPPRYRCFTFFFLLLWLHSAIAEDLGQSRRTAIVRAAERVKPAVASIQVIHTEPVYYRYRDPFRDLFFPFSPLRLYRGYRDRVSGGSGLIVTENGHVLTNDHVIGRSRSRNAPEIEVSLPDGRTLPGRHVGSDFLIDLAVLKVEADDLPVAHLGDSDDILVGEWAIAIGNPFDLGPAVSAGVVSALDLDFPEPQGDYYYRDMIQTDASINPGNSGGPLANALGEVIGINSFIYTANEYDIGSIGIGFAIPINYARRFLDEIATHGRVRRPWTGILELQNLTLRQAEYLDLPGTGGAQVVSVATGSPAYEADLERGDVIVRVNGDHLESAEEAKAILEGLRVGETCHLDLFRNGRQIPVSFEVAERPSSPRRWD